MTDLILQDDVVRAVLDFIDAYDSDVQLEIPTQAEVSVPRPRRHSSQRVRDEIRHLRGALAELEAHLSQLTHGVSFINKSEAEPNHSKSSWKKIALSRKLQRFRAQADNACLRHLVDEKHQHARKLEKRLVRRRKSQEKPRVLGTPLIADDCESTWPSGLSALEAPGHHLLSASIS